MPLPGRECGQWGWDMPLELPDRSGSLLSMTLNGDEAVLGPIRLRVREAISEPYEIEVTAVHVCEPFAAPDILQKPAVVTLRRDGLERKFHGLVREYVPLGQDVRGYHSCVIRIVPKLWALSLANDCRIFQEKTAQEILEALFTDSQITGTEFSVATNPALPYRTQYNEDRLRFASRIMEEAGWFYFFKGETLVVTDDNASLEDIGALPGAGALVNAVRPVHAVARAKEFTADYNPVSPTTEVKGEQATVLKATGALSPDSFVWPSLTTTADEAAARARLRMEAAEAAASLLAGTSEWIELAAGHLFEVLGDDSFLPAGKFAVRSVVHEAADDVWLNGGGGARYENSFEVFPEATTWRQPFATRRPRMDGIHAAIVIGSESEKNIHTDDLGRVKVKFFWDHRGDASPEGDAIWARVVQPWAGKGWGAQFIPRVGTEVAIGFMDGDPDRPVVLGGLYNGVDTPIFSKAEKMKSGFRSRSTDDGSTAHFNEFSFDDKKDSELVFLHAQKNFKIEVEYDLNLKVDNCRITEVKVDDTVTIKGKQDVKVKGDRTFEVEEGNYKLTITKGNLDEKVDTGNYKMGVSKGTYDVKADAGAITIEAGQTITLKVGGSSLEITASGITLKAPTVTVKADGQVAIASPATEVKGDGMLTLKGGMVMIN